MSYLQTKALSHAQRVCKLYKQALRNCQSYNLMRHEYRYDAVLMRARFDEHKDEVDMIKARKLLEEGEAELAENLHPQPFKFPYSPGGIAFNREVKEPDWLLDMWHPLERLQYPEYFARRHQRKLEFIKRWEEKYGPAQPDH